MNYERFLNDNSSTVVYDAYHIYVRTRSTGTVFCATWGLHSGYVSSLEGFHAGHIVAVMLVCDTSVPPVCSKDSPVVISEVPY